MAPSTSAFLPEFWKVISPPSPPSPPSCQREALEVQLVGEVRPPPSAPRRRRASAPARRPRSRARASRGPAASRSARSKMPSVSVCRSMHGELRVLLVQARQLVAEDHPLRASSRSSAATTSPIVPRRSRVRSIDITGVIPLPPTRKKRLGRRRVRQHEVAVGRRQPHDRAGRQPVDQVVGEESLRHRADGDRKRAARRGPAASSPSTSASGTCRRPATPMPTYWPGRCW